MTDDDITSPTVVLTGPTRGIGASMLDRLLEHPSRPNLVLLARDPFALERAVRRAHDAGVVATGIPLDLADLRSVDAAIDELRELIELGELAAPSAIMLNAGAQFGDRRGTSVQGVEQTFAVNVVAQHALVRGLLPLLAPSSHLLLMGSSTHRGRLQSFGLLPSPRYAPPAELAAVDRTEAGATRQAGGRAYSDSKLALVTLAHAWARRAAASGHRLNTYDPGLVPGTGLTRTLPDFAFWGWEHVMPVMAILPKATTPRTTARHAIELLLGDRHEGLHGGYVEIGRATLAAEPTFDLGRQEELFAWIEGRFPAAAERSGAVA
ncbi:SDR family NAD(P)-dependent oxidoreductase [Agromyces bracchium]|uniref:SDR family NAD(P)-dependent oxidoreductase n=1 Tax=Agromyces bracchium TaxID=88376 RepID=A0A6I3M6X2_9MICO|nr:SDR family NAD(P)-dependent oxidoreductase [Agromyces bracchium]MTH67922.1 SDR family NAD(P)-dependent oxidoreductase [Agromyces bracchium]